MSKSSSSDESLTRLSPLYATSGSPKLTKLNSSSESNSEQKEDSKEGCSTVKEPSAGPCEDTMVATALKAILASSSSVERVGSGGQTVAVATIVGASNEPEVRSRRLTNSATGAGDTWEAGDAGESEGEVQLEKGLAS